MGSLCYTFAVCLHPLLEPESNTDCFKHETEGANIYDVVETIYISGTFKQFLLPRKVFSIKIPKLKNTAIHYKTSEMLQDKAKRFIKIHFN